MMKKSLNAWSVPDQVSFEDMFKALKKAGFDGVELNLDAPGRSAHSLSMETTDAELDRIAAISRETGLKVSGISSSLWGLTTLGNPDASMKAEDVLAQQIKCAQKLGADGILIVPGGIGDNCSIKRAWDNAKAVLENCRGIIENGGVMVGVENVWNNFFISPMDMARFIDEMNIKNLGTYFDVGNVEIFSYPEYWIEILGSRIQKIHVKDFKRAGGNAGHFCNLLEGSVHWKKVVDALKAAGYDSYLTAELAAMPETPEYLYDITKQALETIIAM